MKKMQLAAFLPALLVPAGRSCVRPDNSTHRMMTVGDILKLPVPLAGRRVPYGPEPLQFGDLRLPKGAGPFPVAIVIHGGCWLAEYNLDHIASFADALTRAGVATWSLEYRRVGDRGGGWPGTFEDVARGAEYVTRLARDYPLDPTRVAAVGHSAGGHLALWLAARHRLPKESPLYSPDPIRLRGVVSLAGIPDLRRAFTEQVCGDAAERLLGGSPAEVPDRYAQASPLALLPLGVPQRLVQGAADSIVPPALAQEYRSAAEKTGDDATLVTITGAGHFELIAPGSPAWSAVREAIFSLL